MVDMPPNQAILYLSISVSLDVLCMSLYQALYTMYLSISLSLDVLCMSLDQALYTMYLSISLSLDVLCMSLYQALYTMYLSISLSLDVLCIHLHQSHYMYYASIFITLVICCPLGSSCRMQRGKPPTPTRESWIWHYTISWWSSSDAEALGNAEHPFIAIAPRSILARNGSIW